jgi:hypothetical protein
MIFYTFIVNVLDVELQNNYIDTNDISDFRRQFSF